jgi:hypothetical protein
LTFDEPGQADNVIGSTGGWGTVLDEASVVVGFVSAVVEVVGSAIVVSTSATVVVSLVEPLDPHEETMMAAIARPMSDRMGDGRRMSS